MPGSGGVSWFVCVGLQLSCEIQVERFTFLAGGCFGVPKSSPWLFNPDGSPCLLSRG